MKTLVLMRHAKSSWDTPGLLDHDRPLNERGRREAPRMGRRLGERGIRPDVIVTSTAERARSTAAFVAAALGTEERRVIADERLYSASVDTLLRVVRSLDDRLACAMFVGHNPEMTDLAARLFREAEAMPTAAVAVFRFDVASWSDVRIATHGGRSAAPPVSVTFDAPDRSPLHGR
ncbi:histidine phosphatase [Agromyces badenianii]|uniref:Histidine phosphatase n=1 Tax=Agromyces badenianii TaxID=2080742 RepID=A0A2S0WYT9_9MICO|nr:histidine phosphatase family protein [Agromyces badenianii]AWB96471.1 histidine phosphatase [Agromyces badenianii]PWC05329.1 histidine phosphatase family protein [Agromyces badenianii]